MSRLARRAVSRLDPTSPILGTWRDAVPDLRPVAAQVAQWRDLAAWVLTQQGTVRVSVNKNQGFPPGSDATADMFPRVGGTIRAFTASRQNPYALQAYGGDLKGNIWRFDLSNADPTKWKD